MGTFLFASNQREPTNGALVIFLVLISATVTSFRIKGCGISLRDLGFQRYLFESNLFRTCTLAPYSSFHFFKLLKYKEIKRGGSGCMLGA